MSDAIDMHRETIDISGGRQLYSYTFGAVDPQTELLRMIETGEIGVIAAFVGRHPDMNLDEARSLAERLGNTEALRALSGA